MDGVNQDQSRFSIKRNIFNLQNELKCPICLSLKTKPKLTNCSHLFCEECLDDLVQRNDENYPPCPLCKRILQIPKSGVQSIRTETNYQMIIQEIDGKEMLSPDVIKTLRSALNCGMCHGSYINPKRITCGHIFCFQCLLEHRETNPSHELTLLCPKCKERSEIPENGIEGFYIDPLFFNIVKELTVITVDSGLSANAKCDGTCDSVTRIATKCESCEKIFCKDCSEKHSFYKPNSVMFEIFSNNQNDEKPIKPKFTYPSPITTTHSHKTLRLYCDECDEPVCKVCKDKDHSTHCKSSMLEMEKEHKQWLKETQEELECREEFLKVKRQSLATNYENFNKELSEIKQSVEQSCEFYVNELIEKKRRFLDELKDATKGIQDYLETEMNENKQHLTEVRSRLKLIRECSDCRCAKGIHMLKRLAADFTKNKKMLMQQNTCDIKLSFEKGIAEDLDQAIDRFNVGDYHVKQTLHFLNMASEEMTKLNKIHDENNVFESDTVSLTKQKLHNGKIKHITKVEHRHSTDCSNDINVAEKEVKFVLRQECNSKLDSVKIKKIFGKILVCETLRSDGSLLLNRVIGKESDNNTIEVWGLSIDDRKNAIVGLKSSSTKEKTLWLYSSDGKRSEQLQLPYDPDEMENITDIRACDIGTLCISLNDRHVYFYYLS